MVYSVSQALSEASKPRAFLRGPAPETDQLYNTERTQLGSGCVFVDSARGLSGPSAVSPSEQRELFTFFDDGTTERVLRNFDEQGGRVQRRRPSADVSVREQSTRTNQRLSRTPTEEERFNSTSRLSRCQDTTFLPSTRTLDTGL